MVQGTCIRAYATVCGRLITEESKPVTNHPAPPTAHRAPAVRALPSAGYSSYPAHCSWVLLLSSDDPTPGGLASSLTMTAKNEGVNDLAVLIVFVHRITETSSSRKPAVPKVAT